MTAITGEDVVDREPFVQAGPMLPHPFREDPLLRAAVRRHLPAEHRDWIEADLERFATRVRDEVEALGRAAEATPPALVPFDPWGRRVDRVDVSAAWLRLRAIAAEEGLVATGYERRAGPWSRLHQHLLLLLFGPSSAIYTCPLAMTDGAGVLLEELDDRDLSDRVLRRLTSRDPEVFWTAGQWMTERTGGSDVGRSETVARPTGDGGFRLWGWKWFTSAIDADVAFTLARIEGAPAGSRGLSLFYLELAPEAEAVRVDRLKDKLGTRALPTAELTLEGARARLLGVPGRGVPTIARLMNTTRIHNATAAVGLMRRSVALARDYAARREAFGRPLLDHPLHRETLAELESEASSGLAMLLDVARLQGEVETAGADPRLLRGMTPLVKLVTARQAVRVVREALECFGGAGYVEDTGLPRLLRDAHVLPIWEGTTNVLALDLLRAIGREEVLDPLFGHLEARLEGVPRGALEPLRTEAERSLVVTRQGLERVLSWGRERVEAAARSQALALGRLWGAVSSLWMAGAGDPLWAEVARRRLTRCEGVARRDEADLDGAELLARLPSSAEGERREVPAG